MITCRIYRNEGPGFVFLRAIQVDGYTEFQYQPPNATPAHYLVEFYIDGVSGATPGTMGRRTLSVRSYRR